MNTNSGTHLDIRANTVTAQTSFKSNPYIVTPYLAEGEVIYNREDKSLNLGVGSDEFIKLVGESSMGDVPIEGGITLDEQASPPIDPTGTDKGVIWVQAGSPNVLIFTDDTGVSTALGGGGMGEVNTASNVGVSGVGPFKQKIGTNLEFNTINSASARVTVALDGANNEIDIDVSEVNLNLANIGGTLPVTSGGTGATTLTDGGIVLGSGTGAVTTTAQPTDGQLLIGSTGSDPTLSTLTAGSGISVVNGGGTVTISTTGAGVGDVVGPASATDNAIARFDSTTGKLIQNSTVTVSDTAAVANVLSIEGQSGTALDIATTNNQNLSLSPNGTGEVLVNSDLNIVSGNITIDPSGGMILDSNFGNNGTRPAAGGTTIQPGEIRAFTTTLSTDAAFLRAGAGGGTGTGNSTFTDYIGFNAVAALTRSIYHRAQQHLFVSDNDVVMVTINALNSGITSINQTVDMVTNRITNLADPVNPQDAATKNYVDTNGGLNDLSLRGELLGTDLATMITVTVAGAGTLSGISNSTYYREYGTGTYVLKMFRVACDVNNPGSATAVYWNYAPGVSANTFDLDGALPISASSTTITGGQYAITGIAANPSDVGVVGFVVMRNAATYPTNANGAFVAGGVFWGLATL